MQHYTGISYWQNKSTETVKCEQHFMFGWHRPRYSCMLLVLWQTWHCWSILEVWALNHRRPLLQLYMKKLEKVSSFTCRCKGHLLHCEICAIIIINLPRRLNTKEAQASDNKAAAISLHWECFTFTLYEKSNTNEMVMTKHWRYTYCGEPLANALFSYLDSNLYSVLVQALALSTSDPSVLLDRLQPPPSPDQD